MKILPRLLRFWRRIGSAWLLIPLSVLAGLVGWGQMMWPQLPTSLVGDTLATSLWLDRTAASGLERWLGFYNLAQQPWVRALVTLLALILVLRLWGRLLLAWQVRILRPPQQWLPLTTLHEARMPSLAPDDASLQVLTHSSHRHARRQEAEASSWEWIGDWHHRRLGWQSLLELGLLLLLLLLVWQLRHGWQKDAILLAPTESLTLSPYTSQTLQMDADGQMIRLCCQPQATMAPETGTLSVRGFHLQVQRLIPALQVQAHVAGQPLNLQSLDAGQMSTTLLLQFPQERSERAVAIPDRNLVLVVVAQDTDRYQLQLRDAENTPIMSSEISHEGELHWQDVRFQLQATHTSVLSVRYRPGTWLLWPAGLMLLLGLWAAWRWPYLRIGIRSNAAGTVIRWQGQWSAHPTVAEISHYFHSDEQTP